MTETQLKKILAATDFSDDAGNAALRAAMLATEWGGELELLHVMNGRALDAVRTWIHAPVDIADRLVQAVQRSLVDHAETIATKKTGISARVNVRTGDVLAEILASCMHVDMLAVGARGTNSIHDVFVGTTAERLLGKCKQPILVVKQLPAESYARVMVPVDFSPSSEQALRIASQVVPNARIVAVHAYEVAYEGRMRLAGVSDENIDVYRERVAGQAAIDMNALWEKLGLTGQRFGNIVERGNPPFVIQDQALALGADLIVMGKHARSGVGEFFLGSVTRRVLAESACDVLVVHSA